MYAVSTARLRSRRPAHSFHPHFVLPGLPRAARHSNDLPREARRAACRCSSRAKLTIESFNYPFTLGSSFHIIFVSFSTPFGRHRRQAVKYTWANICRSFCDVGRGLLSYFRVLWHRSWACVNLGPVDVVELCVPLGLGRLRRLDPSWISTACRLV